MRYQRLLTRKADAAAHRLDAADFDSELPAGQLQLAVRRVAITTNNITYALFGEQMQYWRFFPSGEPEWGIVPVWGFADVVASTVAAIAVGERIYGYLPLAEQLRLAAERVTPEGFADASLHRRDLPTAYNRYLRCAADASHRVEDEDVSMIMRPLFGTAYLLSGFLRDQGTFGATQVLLSSASSKTAYATAWCLREAGEVTTIGLTSAANLEFVRSLGCYDRVLAYDEVETLAASAPSVYADFSGNAALRARLHHHFGDALRHSAVIGATQFSAGPKGEALPGAKPTFFFAPEQMRRSIEAQGAAAFRQGLALSQRAFVQRACEGDSPWLRVVHHQGLESGAALMARMARGQVDPRLGHALVLGAER